MTRSDWTEYHRKRLSLPPCRFYRRTPRNSGELERADAPRQHRTPILTSMHETGRRVGGPNVGSIAAVARRERGHQVSGLRASSRPANSGGRAAESSVNEPSCSLEHSLPDVLSGSILQHRLAPRT